MDNKTSDYYSIQEALSLSGAIGCSFFVGFFAAKDYSPGVLIMFLLGVLFLFIFSYFSEKDSGDEK